MSKENKPVEPIEMIQQKAKQVAKLVKQRENLVYSIGVSGEVRAGASMATTIKVGRVRSRVQKSVMRLRAVSRELQKEYLAYEFEVPEYFFRLEEKQRRLAETSQAFHEGRRSLVTLRRDQERYETFVARHRDNLYLHRGIERLRQGKAR